MPTGKPKAVRSQPAPRRRPPPRHQLTLNEALVRLGVPGVTSKAMFGGRCYYVDDKPFSFVLGDALALRLSPRQLAAACERGDGQVFHPGGGDFIMREYLELSPQALSDEEKIDTCVQASTGFMGGQEAPQEGLTSEDLRHGRERLYKRPRPRRRP